MVLECAAAVACVCIKSVSFLLSHTLGTGVLICRLHAFVRKLQCVVHCGFAAKNVHHALHCTMCNRITSAPITITTIVEYRLGTCKSCVLFCVASFFFFHRNQRLCTIVRLMHLATFRNL